MRIGIISDIHANLEALTTVIETLGRLSLNRTVCLGDLVGYGANPEEAVRLVRPLVDFTIMGNHDAAVVGQMDTTYYYDAARDVIDWTRAQLSAETLKYLASLPYFRVEDEVCYVHGDPVAPEQFNYIYTLDHAWALQRHYANLRRLTFVGHSHLRRVYELSERDAIELPVKDFEARPDRKYLIAIGSVGQPRDYDPKAAFAVYDTERSVVEFHRVEYDVATAADKILKAGLSDYFANRLFSGA